MCEEAEEKGMKKKMEKGWDDGAREGGKGELNLVRYVREVLFLQEKKGKKQQIEKQGTFRNRTRREEQWSEEVKE